MFCFFLLRYFVFLFFGIGFCFPYKIKTYSVRILPIHAIFSGHRCCKNGLMNFNLAHAAIQQERWLANQRTRKLLMSENSTKDIGKLKHFMQDKDHIF